MRKVNYQSVIKESVDELIRIERSMRDARLKVRIMILRLLKESTYKTMKGVCREAGVSREYGVRMWQRYKSRGIGEYMRVERKGGKKRKISDEKLERLTGRAKEGFKSLKEAVEWTKENLEVSYSQNGLWCLFKTLKIKSKTGRHKSYKHDKGHLADL